MKTPPSFEELRDEYSRLWDAVRINPTRTVEIDDAAKAIAVYKDRYQKVEHLTGVPWTFIGAVHSLECGLSFKKHLHNGDPLTERTRLVPAGHPKAGNPPFTWEESAVDALNLKNLSSITEWTPDRLCYELERYNGFGYRLYHPETLSPYLWAGTNHYQSGKYVRDGKWSSSAVSKQIGAVPLICRLQPIPETASVPSVPKSADDWANLLK